MNKKKMPVVFAGHGSPMLALENNSITKGLSEIGSKILYKYGKPKAILAISAHWYVEGTFVQTDKEPKQIYDMYGFPKELYEVKYPVKGSKELSLRVQDILGGSVTVNNQWGIDHGVWTVLIHMFPNADIPVVQLSVDAKLPEKEIYDLGKKLESLRSEGYLIFASGNVVHNLMEVEWDNDGGTTMAEEFNDYIVSAVISHKHNKVIHYQDEQNARYAVPTDEHYLPLIYALGAAGGDDVKVFNNECNLGSMAMTGFIFE